jgi:NAD(P)H-dependent flavin oxidoreductase YrpB (nitropropane dioxygenase family)
MRRAVLCAARVALHYGGAKEGNRMHAFLDGLGVTLPVLAAPMAGGPTTPRLVMEAARAGGLGFLAGGYKTPEALVAEIKQARHVGGRELPFGVNLFAPGAVPVDTGAYRTYRKAIQQVADRYEIDLTTIPPNEDDDHWHAKIELLLAQPVPLVSFTFAVPDAAVITALQRAGTVVAQTVTTVDEARLASHHGVDLLIVQGIAAGGHSATLTPSHAPTEATLTSTVRHVANAVDLPIIAAGGIATASDVARAIRAGAEAVMVGTALLLSPESGASAPHRQALREHRDTVVTRAFTGRPARALRNEFITHYSRLAPAGYPALHHLTIPIRKAGVAAGDPEVVNLWAGTGYHHASTQPAGDILVGLAAALS